MEKAKTTPRTAPKQRFLLLKNLNSYFKEQNPGPNGYFKEEKRALKPEGNTPNARADSSRICYILYKVIVTQPAPTLRSRQQESLLQPLQL